MSKLQELHEKRATLIQEFNNLDGKADKTAEDRAAFEKIYEEFSAVDAEIRTEEKVLQMRAELATSAEQRVDQKPDDTKQAYEKVFWRYIQVGERGLTSEERGILNAGAEQRSNKQSKTVGAGGYTVPEGFSNDLEIAEKYYNEFSAANGFKIVTTASGNDMPWPGTNDTAQMGRMLAEAANAETSAVGVTFTQPVILKAFKGTSDMIRMSREIMEDSYFNFQQEIANLLAERMGRLKSYQFTLGAGTTAPHGIVTKVKATSGLRVVAAASTAITRTDIVNLIYSIDYIYRNKPNFKLMMHDQILKLIVLMAIGTNDDRPLWTPGMAFGRPDTIEGVPYLVNNNMANTLAINALTVIAGDMSKYVVRQVADRRVHVTEERFIDTDEVGIVMFERFDGQLLDAGGNPIKGLYHSKT